MRFKDCPWLYNSNMRRIVAASLATISSFTPSTLRTLRYPNTRPPVWCALMAQPCMPRWVFSPSSREYRLSMRPLTPKRISAWELSESTPWFDCRSNQRDPVLLVHGGT